MRRFAKGEAIGVRGLKIALKPPRFAFNARKGR